jgi:hypothetical protein
VIALVDDQRLSAILRGYSPPDPSSAVATTGCWYLRLCQAVLDADERTGALSRPFAVLPPAERASALRTVLDLPADITLVSLRDLAPLMAELRRRHPLNLLSLEALAAAVHLDADVVLSTASPRLQVALAAEGRSVTVVPLG